MGIRGHPKLLVQVKFMHRMQEFRVPGNAPLPAASECLFGRNRVLEPQHCLAWNKWVWVHRWAVPPSSAPCRPPWQQAKPRASGARAESSLI